MPNPVTCVNCQDSLPANEASICNPQVQAGQIQRILLTKLDGNQNFDEAADPVSGTEINDPAAWSARMDQTAQAVGAIVTLHVIASKPRPEATKTDISLGRKRQTGQKHIVPFKVDEVNPVSHDFWRKVSQCGFQGGAWYETSGKLLFGSTEGVEFPIKVSIAAGMVIPVERGGVITWEGEMEWEEMGTENYIASVVPDAEEPAES